MSVTHSDPAMGDLGYERVKADFYPTPEWATNAVIPTLLARRPCYSKLWEPACGDGKMAKVLGAYYDTHASDLNDYGYGETGRDFLAEDDNDCQFELIVTNPPYGDLAEAFIKKAIRLTKNTNGIVAMLLRNEYDSAKERATLFKFPFAEKLVLTSRPKWIENSTGSPRHNYAWFIWDWQHGGSPILSHHVRKGK